jgi:hypothetical protein
MGDAWGDDLNLDDEPPGEHNIFYFLSVGLCLTFLSLRSIRNVSTKIGRGKWRERMGRRS